MSEFSRFDGSPADASRLEQIRATILGHGSTRAGADTAIAAILTEVADLDDDEHAPEPYRQFFPDLTAGELRHRLRVTLSEIADHERSSG